MKKRLVILLPGYFEEHVGGAEYQTFLIAQAAQKRGFEVHYVFQTARAEFENPLQIHLHPMPRIKLKRKLGAVWSLYYWRLSRILNDLRPDVIYVRGGISWAGIAARYAHQVGCRSIWHVASSADVSHYSFFRLLIRPFDFIERRAIRYAIDHSDHVVAQAHYQSEMLEKNFGRASTVITNCVEEPKESLDKGVPFMVVWVANLKPLKQPEMFIRLARAFQDESQVRFVMVGRRASGEYQKKLDTDIATLPNLEYKGEQPIEKVNELLARSHIFVNTSTYEGLPNTFVQSWMREVPVVSMLLDPDDILTKQKVGFISGSFEQMVRDVRSLLENPSLRDEMGKRARKYALEHHSLEKNMGRLLELFFEDRPTKFGRDVGAVDGK